MVIYRICHHKPLKERFDYFSDRMSLVGLEYAVCDSFNLSETVASLFYKFPITKPELSLYLKHVKILKDFKDLETKDVLCIMEDDCEINGDFAAVTKICAEELIAFNYDIAFLGTCCGLHIELSNPKRLLQYEPGITSRCTHCYIVSKEGCNKILENGKIYAYNLPIDLKLNEIILDSGLSCAWYEPGIPQNAKFKSSLRFP